MDGSRNKPRRPLLSVARAIAIAATLSGCSKYEEDEYFKKRYADLKHEHESLQKEVETLRALAVQQPEVLSTLRIQLEQEKKARQDAQTKLDELKKEFESFRADRRSGMAGKTLREMICSNGKKYLDVRLKEVTAALVTFTHSGGITKVRLAELSDDLKWEAVWKPSDADEEERDTALQGLVKQEIQRTLDGMDAEMRTIRDVRHAHERVLQLSDAARETSHLLSTQRSELNRAYSAMISRAPSFGRGHHWNSSRPEDSEILNDWTKRPADMGMNDLETRRDFIRATRQRLTNGKKELDQCLEFLRNAGEEIPYGIFKGPWRY